MREFSSMGALAATQTPAFGYSVPGPPVYRTIKPQSYTPHANPKPQAQSPLP